jgi:hypothetical protein
MPSSTPDRSSPPIAQPRSARWRGAAGRGGVAGAAAVLALAGGAATAAGSARAAVPTWQIARQIRSGGLGDITAVTQAGKNDAWAFNAGSVPTAYERIGGRWLQAPFPGKSGERVVVAGASSATNVWAFADAGSRSKALLWNGSGWTVSRSFSKQIGGAVVLAKNDVWVFGVPAASGQRLGSWHYNGTTWTHVTTGSGLEGGSGVGSGDIWAFKGTDVAQWDGAYWISTSLASLLPAASATNTPAIVAVEAESATNVYAIGTGGAQDQGGPTVIMHYNGSVWSTVAQGNYGLGTAPLQQVSSDGYGGLWIPMPGTGGQASALLHYSDKHLTAVALPVPAAQIDVESVANVPGTKQALAGGFIHAAGKPGSGVQSVILKYGS